MLSQIGFYAKESLYVYTLIPHLECARWHLRCHHADNLFQYQYWTGAKRNQCSIDRVWQPTLYLYHVGSLATGYWFAAYRTLRYRNRFSSWRYRVVCGLDNFVGGTMLVTVSFVESIFYMSALYSNPATMGLISNQLGHAVQHLYFIVAAPTLFLSLGFVILGSRVLPGMFGYLALVLGAAFALLGVVSLNDLTLPVLITAFAGIQALWWLAAAIVLLFRTEKTSVKVREPKGTTQ